MRIDPSRLSRLLMALSQPAGSSRIENSRKTAPNPGKPIAASQERDLKVLRKSLHSRLTDLPSNTENYDAAASNIAIQEILMWEFGREILDHPEFHRISASITDSMLQDAKIAASMRKLIRELAS